jgi:hypothetical protein
MILFPVHHHYENTLTLQTSEILTTTGFWCVDRVVGLGLLAENGRVRRKSGQQHPTDNLIEIEYVLASPAEGGFLHFTNSPLK